MPAVGAEGHAVDLAAVPLEREDFAAGLGIPQLQRLVGAAADKTLAVGAEAPAMAPPAVTLEGGGFPSALGVPQSHGLIIAAADECLAVGAEGHAADAADGAQRVHAVPSEA